MAEIEGLSMTTAVYLTIMIGLVAMSQDDCGQRLIAELCRISYVSDFYNEWNA